MQLDHKVAIVAGGGRGIGRAVALTLSQAGVRVIVCDRGTAVSSSLVEDSSVAVSVVDEIQAAGGAALALSVDVTDVGAVQTVFNTAVGEWGRVDIVVNAAGIIRDRMLWNVPADEWDDVINVHLKSCYALTRSFARHARERGTHDDAAIITFSSSAGVFGNVGSSAYGSAKAGVLGFTRIAAMELRRYGVRVNCIVPFAWTRMAELLPDDSPSAQDRLAALRALSPDRIAELVRWVAARDSPELTGQVLGLRGNELLVFAQPDISARALLSGTSEADFDAAFCDIALPPLRASSDVFPQHPVLE